MLCLQSLVITIVVLGPARFVVGMDETSYPDRFGRTGSRIEGYEGDNPRNENLRQCRTGERFFPKVPDLNVGGFCVLEAQLEMYFTAWKFCYTTIQNSEHPVCDSTGKGGGAGGNIQFTSCPEKKQWSSILGKCMIDLKRVLSGSVG